MNQEMGAAALLENAALLVERALGKMDTEQRQHCELCGSRRYRNITEARVHENLLAVPARLRTAAGKLSGQDQKLAMTFADEGNEGGADAARR